MLMYPPKGNRDLIKEINRSLVLNLIKSQGPISRKDLASLSNLSPATVSGITADFIASDLVHEMGEGESTGGRRPILLRLNHQAGFVVGVKLMERTIISALTDLDAQVLYHRVTELPVAQLLPDGPVDPEVVLPVLIQAIEHTIVESAVVRNRVLGIGIGLAGLIDNQRKTCLYSPFFGWRNVEVAEPLITHFNLPVYLENDVNTLTIAEKWFGYGHDIDHFLVITVGRGIGVGIVVNGQFYRGAIVGAGEFGHITLASDGPLCACGKRGCLEALASDPAVVRQAKAAIALEERTTLAKAAPLTIEAIVAAAEKGDKLARKLLADSGHWLGIGVATLINILNPQLVIVGGEGVLAGEWRFDPMRQAIKAHTFNGLADDLDIIIEPSGDEAWARGAACVVLGELFKSPVDKREEMRLRAVRI